MHYIPYKEFLQYGGYDVNQDKTNWNKQIMKTIFKIQSNIYTMNKVPTQVKT